MVLSICCSGCVQANTIGSTKGAITPLLYKRNGMTHTSSVGVGGGGILLGVQGGNISPREWIGLYNPHAALDAYWEMLLVVEGVEY